MSRATIPAGVGFHVGVNFARVAVDTEMQVAEYRGPLAFGFIPANPNASLAFLRRGNLQEAVYVHVQRNLLKDAS